MYRINYIRVSLYNYIIFVICMFVYIVFIPTAVQNIGATQLDHPPYSDALKVELDVLNVTAY